MLLTKYTARVLGGTLSSLLINFLISLKKKKKKNSLGDAQELQEEREYQQ